MSRNTPRKKGAGNNGGHARTRSQHLQAQAQTQFVPTSDYESDTQYYTEPPSAPGAHLANRATMSIPDLNLKVLKRYLPSITSILHTAVNGVVYTFSYDNMTWERGQAEGTVFVCTQLDNQACVVVLNRKGLDNFILNLNTVASFEFNSDLFIFKMDEANSGHAPDTPDGAPTIYGVWTHYDNVEERKSTADHIKDLWASVHATKAMRQAAGLDYQQHNQNAQMGPALQALGRRISLSALFERSDTGC